MKQDIKLYIDDKLVDFSSEVAIPFVYQLEDVNNPTVVKNFFTKTITIVGTKQNNKIFGDIYNFDRTQLYNEEYLTGVYFNPSYRTPFQLFRNGELLESGYMQLNSITLKNKVINYEITLYGGLGDFFYNIMYNDNNEKLKLSDLVYGVQDENGNPIDPEKEMDFNINAHFVKECWDAINDEDKQLHSYISFAPAYNGIYDNFENNKVLINTHNCQAFTTTSKTVSNVKYETYNGYALGELKTDMTEWEIRDLRSYMQRPALRLKKLFEAICNPINNGGYEVELDSDFFNPGNPVWEKSYIGLPLFSSSKKDEDAATSIEQQIQLYHSLNIGVVDGNEIEMDNSYIIPKGDGPLVANGYTITNAMTLPIGTTIDNYVDFQLNYSTSDVKQSNLFDSVMLWFLHPLIGAVPVMYTVNTAVQVVAYDDDNNVVGYSNIYAFSNHIDGLYADIRTKPYDAPVTYIDGRWDYSSSTGKYHFYSREDANTFRLEMKNIMRKSNYNIKLYMWREFTLGGAEFTEPYDFNPGVLYKNVLYSDAEPPQYSVGTFGININGKFVSNLPPSSVYSNSKITKQKLLKTENTPADYLLSYCKMFGLYFSKDNTQKKIYIRQRNNFFTGDIFNWSDRIDYSKDLKINPIVFDKKFYRLALKDKDSYLEGKYKNEYGVDYGQKRINTAYNFNSETTDLLKDSVFENTVPTLSTSQYFRLYYNDNGIEVPTFMVDGINYKLFNVTATEIKTTDINMLSDVNIKTAVNLNDKSGYDLFAKQAFYKLDNGKQSLNDINSCLLFYTGNVFPTLPALTDDEEAKRINYWLTDDKEEMGILNNEKLCYIYTEDEFAEDNSFVGYRLNEIPQFLTYNIDVNTVKDSFDFGVPKESYIPNITYNDSATIYNRYWADFYKDQLDINTKKVTAYVNLEGVNVNSDLLRNFYYFNNSVWILNKVNNYNPNAYGTTQCEFIKVQNTDNYTKQLGVQNKYLTVDAPMVVDYQNGTVSVEVHSSVNWEIGSIYNDNIISISQTSGGPGTTTIDVTYTQNNSYEDKYISFAVQEVGTYMRYVVDITQTPNLNNVVVMSGIVKWDNGGTLPGGRMLITGAKDKIYDIAYINQYTGEYKIYVPKGISAIVEIQANILYGDDAVYRENLNFAGSATITKNFSIPYRTTPLSEISEE